MKTARKVVLLGIDGGTFSLLEPWMDDGTLPRFAELRARGAMGTLASTVPPTTPTAWTTCFTGVNPGGHGIFDFRESPLRHPERPLIRLSSVKVPRLWHRLNKVGKKAIVLNVPITYPPEPLDGCMISGMLTPGPEAEYAYPPALKAELSAAIGEYIPDIDLPKYEAESYPDALHFLEVVSHSFLQRERAFFYLMDHKPWEFFMGVFILADRLQHFFWKYLDPGCDLYRSTPAKRLRGKIADCYRLLDDFLGRLRARLTPDTLLLIMSDHGFGPTNAWFNVSTWLERQGYLRMRREVAFRKKLFYRLVALNDVGWVRALVPDAVQSRMRKRARQGHSAFVTDLHETVDWDRTRAFFPSIPAQGIYINVQREGFGIVPPGEPCEELRREIKRRLEDLRDPDTGERLVDWVRFREEVYHGPETQYAPDILFAAKNYSVLGRQMFGAPDVIRSSTRVANGFHRPDGMFMAFGPGVAPGRRIEGADIADISPTVLYALGLPVPPEMDGKVLTDAFEPGWVAARPVERGNLTDPDAQPSGPDRAEVYTEAETAAIERRLKDLGYLE
ncbi:MAG: alkaline phosphatase family protein [Candidatus Tectomicrobia bacterium]|nr:alkaline phosphatase family protein [Candidatus Tectomicrobia bacterium]